MVRIVVGGTYEVKSKITSSDTKQIPTTAGQQRGGSRKDNKKRDLKIHDIEG